MKLGKANFKMTLRMDIIVHSSTKCLNSHLLAVIVLERIRSQCDRIGPFLIVS